MESTISDSTPSLTPSRSVSPTFPVQPDHFYSAENNPPSLPSTPSSGRSWLSPDDDPLATRGIPVFKPSMDEFRDFEGYMNSIESWGMHSGIVKVIPPKEWTESLPSLAPQLAKIRVKKPIEQHMFGRAGLFRQENIEKRNLMSVREWAELCAKEDFMAPGVDDVALKVTGDKLTSKRKRPRRGESVKEHSARPDHEDEINVVKEEVIEEDLSNAMVEANEEEVRNASASPSSETAQSGLLPLPESQVEDQKMDVDKGAETTAGRKRRVQTKADRDAAVARRDALNDEYLSHFDPHSSWLPPNTKPSDYTPEFCATLERRYWRNCGLGKPPWYGADSAGSLFTDDTTSWNVAHLPSTLSRLIPSSDSGLPGVNMPYLYFGMWRATFAWHVEDMDLFSINYIHFGAPKHWYAIPQRLATKMENTMRSFFPSDTSRCRQFLRHKSFLASPNLLSTSACKPNVLVQHAGEFVITYPRGYHAGFNLGFNCAESINFALESWLDIGRKAQVCGCVGDSVRIDVDELLRAKEEREQLEVEESAKSASPKYSGSKPPRKRKPESSSTAVDSHAKPAKKARVKLDSATAEKPKQTVMLKFHMPKDMQPFPCCLCTSRDETGLLPVHDIPNVSSGHSNHLAKDEHGNEMWRAHEFCAMIVPETWVDEVSSVSDPSSSSLVSRKMVFGVDVVSKDRWNLKCSVCQKARHKSHGAPIQCTKGKCPKAFHISCAKDDPDHRIQLTALSETLKDVPLSGETQPVVRMTDSSSLMNLDVAYEPPVAPMYKRVRKIEYELLCAQHNPIVAAAKKASKQDRVRAELLKLPEMARIKLRVTSGVFEVSLVRVIEDRNAVEVLWDGGVRREFSWNSVVWGKTVEGQQVGQKPSVMAEQHMAPTNTVVNSARSVIRLPLPRSGPLPSTSAMAGPSSAGSSAVHLSSSHSTSNMHSYPHAPPYAHAPNPYTTPRGPNGLVSYSPYSTPSSYPGGPVPVFPYAGLGVGSGTYSYYSTYGQPYQHQHPNNATPYSASSSSHPPTYAPASAPSAQVQPYGHGAHAYPVFTVPLRPLQPVPVSGTTAGVMRRAPPPPNSLGNTTTTNSKGRFATFHVSDPASLAARYGHAQASTSNTLAAKEDVEPATENNNYTSGPTTQSSTSSSSSSVDRSACILTTPISPTLATPVNSLQTSNDAIAQGRQSTSHSGPVPTIEELRAAAKQLEVLGTDTVTNVLDPARLEEALTKRPELREAARLLLTYGRRLSGPQSPVDPKEGSNSA